MGIDRGQAEIIKARGEAWLRLKQTDDFKNTLGKVLADLAEAPNNLNLDEVPFEKLSEAAWNLQGQKMLVRELAKIMRRWEDDANLDLAQFDPAGQENVS